MDAGGRRWPLVTAFDGRHVTLRLDGGWLATAAWPVTIDPLTSSRTIASSVATDSSLAWSPQVAHDRERPYRNNLIAYTRATSASDPDAYARVVDGDLTGGEVVFSDVTASWGTVTTGADNNGDNIFNDRPAGVGRNTERGAAQWSINTQFGYSLGFGRQIGVPGGVAVIGNGAAPTVIAINENPKYRVQFFVAIQNLTNHANYGGYSGTLTSPFFGRPTMVTGTRKVDFGVTLGF